MKIKDLQEGMSVKITLAVLSAELKPNKNKVDKYLDITLFDGSDQINGKMWSYSSPYMPEKNTVVDVTARVGSWQGTPQFTISLVELNTGVPIQSFMPKGDIDIKEYIAKAVTLIDEIEHEELRRLVRLIYNDNKVLMQFVPSAMSIHHAFVAGTLMHHVDSALKAKAIANLIPGCNVDLCVAGAMLHDLGKLWTYELDGVAIGYTVDGNMMDHIPLGMLKLQEHVTEYNRELMILLQHIIASHHGKREYGSPVTPRFLEAWVVSYADGIDAKAQTIIEINNGLPEGSIYTKKEWSLENNAQFTIDYITAILDKTK